MKDASLAADLPQALDPELPVILGKPVLQGGKWRADTLRYTTSARTITQVLVLEYPVCRVPTGRRGPDRLRSEPCSNGASSRNPPRDSLSPVGISFLQEGEDCQRIHRGPTGWS